MKKIIISTLILTSVTLNFSLASEESFINNVKNFFISEKKITEIKEEIKKQIENKDTSKEETKLIKQDLSATSTDKNNSENIDTEIKNSTNTEEKKELKEVVKEEIICENKTKLLVKKDKLSKQIKNQIREKNKLSDGLIEVSANFATETKEKIEDKIIKLEEEVNNIIKIEKNIINIIASSTESACDTKNNKKNILNTKIKSLELENEKQLEKINKFIKKEIKDFLTELKEEQVYVQ